MPHALSLPVVAAFVLVSSVAATVGKTAGIVRLADDDGRPGVYAAPAASSREASPLPRSSRKLLRADQPSAGIANLAVGAAGSRAYADDGILFDIARDDAGGASWLPEREADWRTAQIGFALATASIARCPAGFSATGMVLQHLSQFEPGDRSAMIQAYALDKGPGIVAIVSDSPAARAMLRTGDVIVAVDGAPIPTDRAAAQPFSADAARARTDSVYDLIDHGPGHPVRLTVSRAGESLQVNLVPVPACPSRLHLARSGQRNAYADGRHVFVTTALLDVARSDDELAFILAHEMAHNILGHATVMRGGDVRRGLGRTFGRSGRIVRAAEEAADALAGEMMLDAGYDPVVGAAVLRRLGGGDLGITLFADHASAGRRIAAMRAIVERRRGS